MSNEITIERTVFQTLDNTGNVESETYGVRIYDNEGAAYSNYVTSREELVKMTPEEIIEIAEGINDVSRDMLYSARINNTSVTVDGKEVYSGVTSTMEIIPGMNVNDSGNSLIIDTQIIDGQFEILDTSSTRIEGVIKENLSLDAGISYLRSYQDGTLHHPNMEDLNYLFIREDGKLAYLDFEKEEVEIILDLNEFAKENDWEPTWYYLPGSEQDVLHKGRETFDSALTQEPINPEVPAIKF